MFHQRLVSPLLTCCLLIAAQLAGCASSHRLHTPERSLPVESDRPTVNSPPSFADAEVAAVVKGQLTDDPGVDARNIQVRATQGIVELTGWAPDLLTERRALRVAEAVKGVRAVSDRLELQVETRPDEEISADVTSGLRFDPVTRAHALTVQVKDGRVVL